MNLKEQPLFIPNPDSPGKYLLSPVGVLLVAAESAYSGDAETALQDRAFAQRVVQEVLSAARAAGFTQGQVLETLLANLSTSGRVKELAAEAIESIGVPVFMGLVQRLGWELGHD